MTVVLSIAASDLIIMAADSAVTLDFGDSREYEIGRKTYMYQGVGCVTTWGSRDGNEIGQFLDVQLDLIDQPTIDDLANLTFEYLTSEYRPHEIGLEDVGYHICGFDNESAPRVFHVFWGFDRPKPAAQVNRKYEKYDHSPPNQGMFFLYNGRNDLAYAVVNPFLSEISRGGETRFNLGSPVDRVRLADLAMRFASEITPQVGPPFITHIISQTNNARKVRNDDLAPILQDYVDEEIRELT